MVGEAVPSDIRFIASFQISKHRDITSLLSESQRFPQSHSQILPVTVYSIDRVSSSWGFQDGRISYFLYPIPLISTYYLLHPHV